MISNNQYLAAHQHHIEDPPSVAEVSPIHYSDLVPVKLVYININEEHENKPGVEGIELGVLLRHPNDTG